MLLNSPDFLISLVTLKKSEQFELFDKPVLVAPHVKRDGTVVKPYTRIQKVSVKPPKQDGTGEQIEMFGDDGKIMPETKPKPIRAKKNAPKPDLQAQLFDESLAGPKVGQDETKPVRLDATDIDVGTIGSPAFSPDAITVFGVPYGTSKAQRREWNAKAVAVLAAHKPGEALTDDDRQALRRYSGNGGIGDNLNEYYTPTGVAGAVWHVLVNKFGLLPGADVLEPSCAAGVFLHTAPEGVRVTGVEMDGTSSKIAALLHAPNGHRVENASLERFATQDAMQFDAVIGNPPFGLRGSLLKEDKKELKSAEGYFLDTSLDKTKGGGIVAMVLPSSVMDAKGNRKLRERALRKGEFLGAIRMPNTAFEAAHTDVTTDVVFFRKRPQDVASALMVVSQDVLKKVNAWDDEFLSGRYFAGRGAAHVMGSVATVLSAAQVTGYFGIAALSSSNLLAVAQVMRKRYPQASIIILADLVKATGEPDPHAIEAARSAGGKLAIPSFGEKRQPGMTDMNDLLVMCDEEAVRRAIAGATMLAGRELLEYRDVSLIRASDITPEPITWLWSGWLAAGKMHVFGGAPGTGKTTISMGLAATVTTGGIWPDGTRSIAGNVVVWSGEDGPADTLVPRLALSGADLARVYFITDIREGNERRSFDPARDLEPLRHKLIEIGGVRLLIVDPLVSAIAGDSHKNAEVRRGLQPLVDLAASMNCALLGITHFSKGTSGRDPVERLTGSLAFGALARVVLVAAKYQEAGDEGRTARLFCRAKSNIGADDGGFEYDLHQAEIPNYPGVFASAVLWGEQVEGAARELLATAEAQGEDDRGGTIADAKHFLIDLLADGEMRAGAIFKEADQAGYSKRSIQRAADAVKIQRKKDGMKGGWTWRLPPKIPNALEDAVDAGQKSLSPLAPSATATHIAVEI